MANAKEIRDRMNSVRDTRKITNAMYLIASTKMQKARRELDKTRPYFELLRKEIKRVFANNDVNSKYFRNVKSTEVKCGILVLTADKGLAGSYNSNIIKLTEKLLERYPNHELYVLGQYGRHYFESHQIPFFGEFDFSATEPSMRKARQICSKLLERYEAGNIEELLVVYTDMQKGSVYEPRDRRLIPFKQGEFIDEIDQCEYEDGADGLAEIKRSFEFYPTVLSVLDGMLQSYISGYIYSAMVDAYCCEQNARMEAMDSANRNADKILVELRIQYNRVRQAAITQEITEVSAGAKAQKKKRKKKKCILAE